MKFVKINPPGTFCTEEALRDAIKKSGGKTFLEVGCGGGDTSKLLCTDGMSGVGVDFSEQAIAIARKNLNTFIEQGQYRLHCGDLFELPDDFEKVDVALSLMVMEHVENDVGFIEKISRYVKPGGTIILAVPGRRDRWSFEDETVGHLRRYDRSDLFDVLNKAGLRDLNVWSVSVPLSNILHHIGVLAVKRSSEVQKIGQTAEEQTKTSGIREIPWKTVFPAWVKIILNRVTLWPLFVVQRMFYRTGLGVTMFGIGKVKND
jgi:SAM-dependent methyltransferase